MSPDWSGGRNSLASKSKTIGRDELEGLTSGRDTIEMRQSEKAEVDDRITELIGDNQ